MSKQVLINRVCALSERIDAVYNHVTCVAGPYTIFISSPEADSPRGQEQLDALSSTAMRQSVLKFLNRPEPSKIDRFTLSIEIIPYSGQSPNIVPHTLRKFADIVEEEMSAAAAAEAGLYFFWYITLEGCPVS